MKDEWYADKTGVYISKKRYADWLLYSDAMCLLCGRYWEVNVKSFKLDNGCPKCNPYLFSDYKRTRYLDSDEKDLND